MPVQFEERQKPFAPDQERKPGDGGGGPSRPDVRRPDTKRLMERMKRVDPDQAKRYRQRSGQ